MSTETRPVTLAGGEGERHVAWQPAPGVWSPTQSGPHILNGGGETLVDAGARETDVFHLQGTSKSIAAPTVGPQAPQEVAGTPHVLVLPDFGKSGMEVLSHWEGVVEELRTDGFKARLVPLENGVLNPARVEFSDFSYDELETKSDRGLVEVGAFSIGL